MYNTPSWGCFFGHYNYRQIPMISQGLATTSRTRTITAKPKTILASRRLALESLPTSKTPGSKRRRRRNPSPNTNDSVIPTTLSYSCQVKVAPRLGNYPALHPMLAWAVWAVSKLEAVLYNSESASSSKYSKCGCSVSQDTNFIRIYVNCIYRVRSGGYE
jgi:hypothetical protein